MEMTFSPKNDEISPINADPSTTEPESSNKNFSECIMSLSTSLKLCVQARTNQAFKGILRGRTFDDKILITDSYELPHNSIDNHAAFSAEQLEYMRNYEAIESKLEQNDRIIGWYCTRNKGSYLAKSEIAFQKEIQKSGFEVAVVINQGKLHGDNKFEMKAFRAYDEKEIEKNEKKFLFEQYYELLLTGYSHQVSEINFVRGRDFTSLDQSLNNKLEKEDFYKLELDVKNFEKNEGDSKNDVKTFEDSIREKMKENDLKALSRKAAENSLCKCLNQSLYC